mmetsp:Transcript_5133/g.8393  ORF Transcript_5133/g.8393 Transcript_5133/m.8393 type:complete len:242 (+) Transcript_5133:1474-2199(+)
MVSAAGGDRPHAVPTPAPASMVRRNCPIPIPNTSLRIAFSRSKDSSNPISNKKNTIPNSPSLSTICTSRTQFNPLGPSSMPVSIKPTIGEVLIWVNKGITIAVAINMISASCFGPLRLFRRFFHDFFISLYATLSSSTLCSTASATKSGFFVLVSLILNSCCIPVGFPVAVLWLLIVFVLGDLSTTISIAAFLPLTPSSISAVPRRPLGDDDDDAFVVISVGTTLDKDGTEVVTAVACLIP